MKVIKNLKNKKGFTLIEVVVTITIMAILVGIAGPILGVTIDAILLKVEREDIREQSNYALARMTREMRRIRDIESVVTADASEFEFVNSDGDTIRFRLVGTQLLRQLNGGTERVLAENVTALNLTYYYIGDGDIDVAIAAPVVGIGTVTDIQRIQIELEFTIGSHVLRVKSHVKPYNFYQESDVF